LRTIASWIYRACISPVDTASTARLGRWARTNITPDPDTGIGRWTEAEIAMAVREGRRPDGSVIGPPMPFARYRKMSDADARAIAAYLKSVPSVRNVVTRSSYRISLRRLGATGVWHHRTT
jgi:hypothetical protein